MDGADGEIVLDEVICEIPEKFVQWRLTINTFRGKEYVHIRKYFLSYEGEFIPSREGACIEVNIQRLAALTSAFFKTLSHAEAVDQVLEYLDEETLQRLYEAAKERGRLDVREGDAHTDG